MIAFIRHPATRQERVAVASAEEQGVRVRPSRRGHRLPNEYDDVGRLYTRNWKSQRRTQYKAQA
jgi:hypothetical protein